MEESGKQTVLSGSCYSPKTLRKRKNCGNVARGWSEGRRLAVKGAQEIWGQCKYSPSLPW